MGCRLECLCQEGQYEELGIISAFLKRITGDDCFFTRNGGSVLLSASCLLSGQQLKVIAMDGAALFVFDAFLSGSGHDRKLAVPGVAVPFVVGDGGDSVVVLVTVNMLELLLG